MTTKLILKMHISVDGFVCTPTGDNSWLFAHMDASVNQWEIERLWQAGVHIMGSRLYQMMASYWPTSTTPNAAPMNEIPKVVFSSTLKQATWGETRIVDGDLAEEIGRLRQQADKDILAHGGSAFAQSLSRLNLVDEYRLLIHPLALGEGKTFINSPVALRLTSSQEFPSGVVALTYVRNSTVIRKA
jgi:dihydrofolate reductase